MPQLERIAVPGRFNAGEPLLAMDETAKNQLWNLRRKVGEAVQAHSTYKEEDTVVPRGHLPELLAAVKRIGAEHGFDSVCYGHAGDGNLHVNILKGDLTDAQWNDTLPDAIRKLFREVIRLGGTLSGEHGIGWVQKPFMDLRFNPAELALQQRIKDAFDPVHILNPDKILPEAEQREGRIALKAPLQTPLTIKPARRKEGHHFRRPQRHVHRLEDGGNRSPHGRGHRVDQRPRCHADGRDPQTRRTMRQRSGHPGRRHQHGRPQGPVRRRHGTLRGKVDFVLHSIGMSPECAQGQALHRAQLRLPRQDVRCQAISLHKTCRPPWSSMPSTNGAASSA